MGFRRDFAISDYLMLELVLHLQMVLALFFSDLWSSLGKNGGPISQLNSSVTAANNHNNLLMHTQ